MAGSLAVLRQTVITAVEKALADTQMALAVESETVISAENWSWYWRKDRVEKRDIVDTGTLRESLVMLPLERDGNTYSVTLEWDPIQEANFRYAGLVHNGAKDFFVDDPDEPEDTRDYVARPWTFRLAPKESRDSNQLNAIVGEEPEDYDETSWNVAMRQFHTSFRNTLATRFKVV